jgi:uncharacterized circularly permuted ATP-grasp superfamily protein/uncharacterized alpha-E superfamily protein
VAQTGFQLDAARDAADLVLRHALAASAGHRDELRAAEGALRAPWREFFARLTPDGLDGLDRRLALLARRIREDGVTYNVHGDEAGPKRPWSLDLLPFIIADDEWAVIEQGIGQRAALLDAIFDDVYGPATLLREGLLPAALVHGHPGYLRPLVGAALPGTARLYLVAFDLARAEDGRWWVVSQRTQAPSGLGYALQNRLIVSRLFPEAFREMRVQRLASSYRRLLDGLLRASRPLAGGAAPRLVLLTAGPYSETYFEHLYLARYLGIPLVEGGDLTLRDERVYLKTLHGLERVDAIMRRLDDDFCDPLELRADSTLGVPGLLQAIRAGGVIVANALGSGFLESPALNGFLPAIARRLLGSELALASLDSWWCGEQSAYQQVAQRLHEVVIKPTFPAGPGRPAFEARIGAELDDAGIAELRASIELDPAEFTVQSYLPLSQAPTWRRGTLVPRAAMVRVYAISDGPGSWHAMPGGMTRIAGRSRRVVSIQRGGSSLDTWVLTRERVDSFSMLPDPLRPEDLADRHRPVTSRAAENLFWMGRYAERAEFDLRLARCVLALLADDGERSVELMDAVARLCLDHGLVPAGVPSPAQSLAVFERTLIDGLGRHTRTRGLPFDLDALARTGSQVRDRLATDHWKLVIRAGERFASEIERAQEPAALSRDRALAALARLAVHLSALTGAQTDRMTRDDGWRMLTIGRQLERLIVLGGALSTLFESAAVLRDDGFDLLLELFDSRITYRSLYQRRSEIPPLVDLLVQEPSNPRSLACVTGLLLAELERVPGAQDAALASILSAPAAWPTLAQLCEPSAPGGFTRLLEFAARCRSGAAALSEALEKRYFAHVSDAFRSLGA